MKCPFCGDDQGYYMIEKVHRSLFFSFDDEPIGASEDYTDSSGKRRYCMHCHKILPKKMFKEKFNMSNDIEWGKRCPGCGYCVHADKNKMKCFPESEDCKSDYDLEEADFQKECNCDFFKYK